MSSLCWISMSLHRWADVAALAFKRSTTLLHALSPLHSVTRFWPSKCWNLSKILISQMEKQHLLSYGFTYGSHSCSYEMRQVCRAGGWPPGTLNRGPGPGDSVGPLCREGHAVPSQMNLHIKWGHRETVNMVQTRCYFVVCWLNKLIFFLS